jgi:hypothetical protein
MSVVTVCFLLMAHVRGHINPIAALGATAILSWSLWYLLGRGPIDRSLTIFHSIFLVTIIAAVPLDVLPLAAAIAWSALQILVLGIIHLTGADRPVVIVRLLSYATIGTGLGAMLVESRLNLAGPLLFLLASPLFLLLFAWLREWWVNPNAFGKNDGPTPALGVIATTVLAIWSTATVSPWWSRTPDERFIIRYITEMVEKGEKFDQQAFARDWDRENRERSIVIGPVTANKTCHVFVCPGVPILHSVIEKLKTDAQGGAKISIHPVPSSEIERDARAVAALIRNPMEWAAWLEKPPFDNKDITDELKDQALASLRQTVRTMSQMGVAQTPAVIVKLKSDDNTLTLNQTLNPDQGMR